MFSTAGYFVYPSGELRGEFAISQQIILSSIFMTSLSMNFYSKIQTNENQSIKPITEKNGKFESRSTFILIFFDGSLNEPIKS